MTTVRHFWIALLPCILFVGACYGEDVIIIEDFEASTYSDWSAEGDGFGVGPRESRMVGSLGSGSAAVSKGTGSLTSRPFTVERNAVHFLMGTREHPETGTAGEVAVLLLVDDKVVRSTVPSSSSSKFHAMFWEAWDVSEFRGKSGRIRILDRSNWADIVVDHIFQSDVPAERPILERTISIAEPTLNLPIKTGAIRHYVELFVNGEQVRAMDVELATDEIDYWVVADLSTWKGQDVLIRTRQHPLSRSNVLDRLSVQNGIRDADNLYQEPLRPQFHFSSKRGRVNDPNGLVYYGGEYHLFYQHNPYGWDHSRNDYNKTWGHAVSTDLIRWTELPAAIHPDHLGSIYSGSAVVDERNTTGFQTGQEKPIVAIYTSAGKRSPWSEGQRFSQSVAFSNDRGRTFSPYEGNPVLPNIGYINRDPKVIWYEPTDQWVMVLYLQRGAMAFFSSSDLKSWEFQSEFAVEFEDCPELFQLPVDGDHLNKKWILYGGKGSYFVGEFDGKTYTPETELIRYRYGNTFYASQTFNNMPAEDGRRIQMAWGTIPMEGMPFNQQMLFPVELTLHTTEDGLRMFSFPAEEIEGIYKKEHAWTGLRLKPNQDFRLDVEGELFDIEVEFEVGNADETGILINNVPVVFNVKENELSCGRLKAELQPIDGKIRLRILVDRTTIEIFANDGRLYMPCKFRKEDDNTKLAVFARGGEAKSTSLQVRELESIWE